MFKAYRAKRRDRRLEREVLRLADMLHDKRTWGFADTPSRTSARDKRIAEQRDLIDRLRAES